MQSRRSSVAVVVTLACCLAAGCRTAAGKGSAATSLDALFGDLHQRGLFDGAVVVSDRNGILWEKGFGDADAERGIAFTPDTPTDGASLAKTFTAALLVLLERDGLLSLDDPAQRFLPELPYADITLRHLLSHTSALPVPGYEWFDARLPADQVRTTEVLLGVVGRERPPLVAKPGTSFEYSSFGYDLAALAAARAGGRSYGELLEERLFRPLRIASAFVRPARLSEFSGVRTKGYRRVKGRLELNEVFDLEAFHGGSNVYVSTRDLDRWNRAFLGDALFDDRERATLQSLASVDGRSSGLTLGSWYRSDDGAEFWYSGHLQGFHSEVFRDTRTGRSIAYTSNNTIEPWLQKGIVRAVRSVMAGRPALLERPAVDRVERGERQLLAGRWTMEGGEELIIESGDGLKMWRNGVAYAMFPEGDFFYAPGLDLIVGFADRQGRSPSKIYVSSNVDERWGRRSAAH